MTSAANRLRLQTELAEADRLHNELERQHDAKAADAERAKTFELGRTHSQSTYREDILTDDGYIGGLVRRVIWSRNRDTLDSMSAIVHASQESWDRDEHWLDELDKIEGLGVQELVGNRKDFWRDVVKKVWQEVGKLGLHLGPTAAKAEEENATTAGVRSVEDQGVEEENDDSEESASEDSDGINEQGEMDVDGGHDTIVNARLTAAAGATPGPVSEAQPPTDTEVDAMEGSVSEFSGELDVQGQLDINGGHDMCMETRLTPARSTMLEPTIAEIQPLLLGPELELAIAQMNTNGGDDVNTPFSPAISATPEPDIEIQQPPATESGSNVGLGEGSEDDVQDEAGLHDDTEADSEDSTGWSDCSEIDIVQLQEAWETYTKKRSDRGRDTKITTIPAVFARSGVRFKLGSTEISMPHGMPNAGSTRDKAYTRSPSSNPAEPSSKLNKKLLFCSANTTSSPPSSIPLKRRLDETSPSPSTSSADQSETSSSSTTSKPTGADKTWPIRVWATRTLIEKINDCVRRKDLKGLGDLLQCGSCKILLEKELRLTPCKHLFCDSCLSELRLKARANVKKRDGHNPRRSLVAVVCVANGCNKVFKRSDVISEYVREDWIDRFYDCYKAWSTPAERSDSGGGQEANHSDNRGLEE